MPKRLRLTLLDGAIFVATIAGFALVPGTTIPLWSWPAAFGVYNLVVYSLQLTRSHRFHSAEVGRLIGGVVLLAMAAAMVLAVRQPLPFLAIILAVFLVTGLAWSAVNATIAHSDDRK